MKGLLFGIVIFTSLASVSFAAPQPAVVQGPNHWTVQVRFEKPQPISVKLSDEAKPQLFWYTIITLTNNTKQDVDFYPKCELVTDTFQIIPAGLPESAIVFEKIKKRYRRKYPFLENLETTSHKLLQSEDNTRDIAIIWPDFDPKARNINLFIAGLSNETVAIDHPTETDDTGKPVKILLRKTLQLSYSVAGDPKFRKKAKLVLKEKNWVMR